MRRFLDWFFRNRQTGEITIAQMPNPALWIVLAGSVVSWVWHPPGRTGANLDCLVKAGLVIWAFDEVVRGANPWRRCLGAAVLIYEAATLV
ncbi:hypothetical protein SSBR45G_73410 [Bradyrhizobium sp. SSBR45G]|uniref:hypothetical protein n=1 Tax=unclassified Bradyrhizobium TaxID=2631580 RepID=UPI00234290BB|nr:MULTISPECIES: hypothetical protein [unclassified Bradyrhizobium]GLH82432.1 hypothetical protein SSBR45G_73410 [Bradyrhizobium sp. SSBR45G]GLH89865.1 hypothetical protein SSBR45R_73260 [Bradyrhizobium sp. SSBR45R]